MALSNTITNLIRVWLAQAFASNQVLRNTGALLLNASRDFSGQPQQKSDRVRVPLPAVKTAAAVSPSMTIPTPSDTNIDKVEIVLDQWQYTDFGVNDQELTQMEAGEYFNPTNVNACIAGLIDAVSIHLWGKVHGSNGFFGYVGTAATTPFASAVDILPDAQKVMTDNKSPLMNARAIFNSAAVNNAQKLTAFNQVQTQGSQDVVKEGYLRRAFGFDMYTDQQVPTHTAGTCTGLLINNGGGYAAGIKTVTTDTGAGTVLAGDIITFAGVTGTYRVTSSVGGATVTSVTFYPGLAGAVADNAAITLKASHVCNLAMVPQAMQLVMRPLSGPTQIQMAGIVNGSQLIAQAEMTDPLTGLTVRCTVYRGFGMASIVFDALWGGEVVRPEMGVLMAG